MSNGQFHPQSRFANLHPGGINVLLDEEVAGQDATKVFFGLHRHEVLVKPAYARLQIGTIKDENESILAPQPGDLSKVPYAEPTWLTSGYYSPYFKEASIPCPWIWYLTYGMLVYAESQEAPACNAHFHG
jgi:cytochrome b involved in lipid metabolism